MYLTISILVCLALTFFVKYNHGNERVKKYLIDTIVYTYFIIGEAFLTYVCALDSAIYVQDLIMAKRHLR